MIQLALLLLVVIALLGMGGKWLRRPPPRNRPAVEAAHRCPTCQTFVVGRSPAACGREGCPYA